MCEFYSLSWVPLVLSSVAWTRNKQLSRKIKCPIKGSRHQLRDDILQEQCSVLYNTVNTFIQCPVIVLSPHRQNIQGQEGRQVRLTHFHEMLSLQDTVSVPLNLKLKLYLNTCISLSKGSAGTERYFYTGGNNQPSLPKEIVLLLDIVPRMTIGSLKKLFFIKRESLFLHSLNLGQPYDFCWPKESCKGDLVETLRLSLKEL